MPKRATTPVTLPGALLGLVLSGIAIFAGTTYVLVRQHIDTFQQAALEEAVTLRTRGVSTAFARALEQDWQHLTAIAREVAVLDPEGLAPVLDAAAGPDQRISWAGFARPDGTVIVASGGLLEGGDVSSRPWFQQGLQEDFAGDMHEAVLLADLMAAGDSAPPRFLDLATPVEGPGGRVVGVLGFHINAAWAEDYLADLAERMELDLLLVNPAGEVMIGTAPDLPDSFDLPRLSAAAATGVQTAEFDIWPDGMRYFTAVTPSVTFGALPSFGWRLVGRIDPADFPATPARDLIRSTTVALTVATAIFALATVLFIQLYIRPIGRLARNAERIADGHEDYPAEIRASAELQRLSASLARLESQRR
ncbi:HAMP domain-containing protein [Citreimonas sp.]|uniref:cache domain-containing protein n=1 Tax=Citreimonas sp. TaxID=3036715 RepID=UPI0035C7A536